MRWSVAGAVCAWPRLGETIRAAQAVRKIIKSFMSICLDEGLLTGSRMTIDQVCVDNKPLTQESGTGVPPVNHAQDALPQAKSLHRRRFRIKLTPAHTL